MRERQRLAHEVIGTSGNVNDVVPANSLLHGQEATVFADSGYRGAHKRPDAKAGDTVQLKTLFALSNLWMERAKLLILDGQVRPMKAKAA